MAQREAVFKRTKIVATIGPASAAKSVLRRMVRSGMDGARISISRGNRDAHLALIDAVRAAAQEEQRPLAVLLDVHAAGLRVGALPHEGRNLVDGAHVFLRAGTERAEPGEVPLPEGRLSRELTRGDTLLLDDGRMELVVAKTQGRRIFARVVRGGVLRSYAGITVPTAELSLESYTDHDFDDLMLGVRHGVDAVALPHVTSKDEVDQFRRRIARRLPDDASMPALFATITKRVALKRFYEILAAADGVLVSRADLGLGDAAASLPLYQKELVAQCIVAGKPVIVSMHMLSFLQYRPRPTEAEVADMAHAVIDHTDALLLSGETALGRHPAQAVATAAQVIRVTEESPLDTLLPHREASGEPIAFAMGAAAVELARHIGAAAIVVTTHSGYSARAVARFRPEVALFAATDDPVIQRQLAFTWGVVPLYIEGYAQPERMMERALKQLREHYQIRKGSVVVVSGLQRSRGRYDSMLRVVEL